MTIIATIQGTPALLTAAEAADWEAVVAAWPQIRLPDHRASGRETLVALASAGIDANAVLTAVEATPTGRRLLGLLDSAGVNWADPVTQQLLESVVSSGGITQQTADTLTAVSKQVEPKPTADAIQRAWICEQAVKTKRAERDALMTWVANATAELSADKIAGLTIEQLQARCDAVAASDDGLRSLL